MRKVVNLVAVLVFLSCSVGCAGYRETKSYKKACQSNTIQEYQKVLNEFPNTKYKTDIENRMGNLVWQVISEKDSIKNYKKFLIDYKDHKYAKIAQKRIMELEWYEVVKKNELREYVKFAQKYPNTKFSQKAILRAANIALASADHQETMDGYRNFLREFPNHPKIEDIKEAIKAADGAYVDSYSGSIPLGAEANSPDGQKYACEVKPYNQGQIGIFNRANSRRLRLIDTGDRDNNLKGLAWSPNSRYIAAMYHYSTYNPSHISVFDVNSGHKVKKIVIDTYYHFIEFSRNGQKIYTETKSFNVFAKPLITPKRFSDDLRSMLNYFVRKKLPKEPIRGVNYASWTKGEFPWTISWKPETYFDSQGVKAVRYSTFQGRNVLEVTLDLNGQSKNRKSGEVFIDLRYPPCYQAKKPLEAPINLIGQKISTLIFCPADFGNDYTPSGVQIYLKSIKKIDGKEDWSSFYCTWQDFLGDSTFVKKGLNEYEHQAGHWNLISILPPHPGVIALSGGYVDRDFDIRNVALLGIKFGLNSNNQGSWKGIVYIDFIGWGKKVSEKAKYDVCFDFDKRTNPLDLLKQNNYNAICIVPTYYVKNRNDDEIWSHPSKTVTLKEVEKLIKEAQKRHLAVYLKPHIDIETGEWRAEIEPKNADRFFQNYRNFLLPYAYLAQKYEITGIIIGTEYKKLEQAKYWQYWAEEIYSLRLVYDGLLTYAANWDSFKEVAFWNQLDLVGIDAYFPLSAEKNPDIPSITAGWNLYEFQGKTHHWLQELELFSKTINKPVFFSEIGYRSIDYAAREPWNYQIKQSINLDNQQRCFQAAINVFKNKTWFKGFLIWGWSPKQDYGGEYNTDYTPQYKPAMEVFVQNKT